MSNVLSGILPTTELDAVNIMLSVIGESPLPAGTDLSAATAADVLMAINFLKEASRNVQIEGWRFNREFGYQLAPTVSNFSWVDTAGVTTLINIFTLPTGVVKFNVTANLGQIGWKFVDAVQRPSRKYTSGGNPVLVLYDRAHNRDGFVASDYPYLYIDPVWLFDFVMLPEEARTYITILAARRFAARVLGSETLRQFTKEDEIGALRQLKREYGTEDNFSILNNSGAWRMLGGRRPGITGVIDLRHTAGPT